MYIKDGTGNSYLAGVNRRHQLQVEAMIKGEMAYVSEVDGEAYTFSTGNLSIIAESYAAAWVKLPVNTRHIHLDKAWLSWNGGDANHNRVAYVEFVGGMFEPSANYSDVVPLNMNLGSANTSDLLVKKWDGVGAGMTVAFPGVSMGVIHVRQGLTEIALGGVVVIPKDGILGLSVEGEEAGKFALGMTFWVSREGE